LDAAGTSGRDGEDLGGYLVILNIGFDWGNVTKGAAISFPVGGRTMCAPYGERTRLRLIFTAKQKARTHTGAGQKS